MAVNLDVFFTDVLKAIGAPVTPQNLQFLKRWQVHEGGWTNNSATFNPLNTTRGPGKPINSVGVKAFPNYQIGVRSTAETLLNGRYPNLVAGLRSGNPYSFDLTGDLSTWVSGSPTGGLSYAQRVLGTESIGGQKAPALEVPKSTNAQPAFQALSRRKAIAQSLLDFVLNYAQTGEVTSNSVARLVGAVDPKGTVEPPTYSQAKSKARSPLASGIIDTVLAAAHQQVGKPYQFGSGPDTSSFDCSDLIQWAYKQVGINLPRTTYEQIKVGVPVDPKDIQPGDLVFPSEGHVVMYVGGGKVIAAPRTGTVVQYQPLSRFRKIVAVRRIVQ